jgi:hypothetical protein
MSRGQIDPAGMVTHVGGIDAVRETILGLPSIPGGKKLIYTHIEMPLTPLDELSDLAARADEPLRSIYQELDRLVAGANGIWCRAAEEFLLSRDELRFAE